MHFVKVMTNHLHPSYPEKKNIFNNFFYFILAYTDLHTSI